MKSRRPLPASAGDCSCRRPGSFHRRLLLPILLAALMSGVSAQSVQDYRRQVATLVSGFEWDEARDTVTRALRNYPDDAYLLVLAAALESREGDRADADTLLEKALRHRLPSQLLRLAATLKLKQGQRLAARQLLLRAIEQQPRDPWNHYQLAYLSLAEGDTPQARDRIARAVELDPRNPRLRNLFALVLERLDERDAAYEQLREAQRMAPDDTRLLLRLSDRERLRDRPGQALEYLDLAAELDPENPLYPAQAADLYDELGRLEEAQQSRQRARRLQSAFDAYGKALTLAGAGQLQAAVDVLSPVVEQHPEFQTGGLLLGQLYRQLGRQEMALEVYLGLLARDPARSEAREELAWIRAQSGELEAAVQTLQEGSARSINEWLLKGHRQLQNSEWSKAMDYFRRVEEYYPLNPRLLQLISFTLNEMGQVEEALAYLEKAHRIVPADPAIKGEARTIRAEHGLERIESGKFEEAEAVFRSLIREEPDVAQHRFHLAYSLQRQGRTDDAIQHYRRGLGVEPNEEWARVNLAACYWAVGQQEAATAQWRELVRMNESPKHIYNLGLSLIRELKLEEGWRLVGKAAGRGFEPARRLLRRAGRH